MLAKILLKILSTKKVYAHCDIPCGVYDPHNAQLAAKTVLTMVNGIEGLEYPDKPKTPEAAEYGNSLIRMTMVKEEHAQICKKEILILWTDYFKQEHLEKFPQLHDLVWKTAKLCSENKRHVDQKKAQELIELVDKIADIFHQTKKG